MSFNFSPRIVRDGLVLYLDAANNKSYTSGSTNWIDLSTGLNNGALQGGPAFNSSNYGNVVFDGSNDYASFSKNPNLYFTGTSPYTLSVFANIVTANATFPGFIKRENSSLVNPRIGYTFWFYKDNATQIITIASERWTGDNIQKLTFVNLNSTECINVWNQYTVTYENSTLKFYLNGELKHTNPSATGNITNTSLPLEIGRLSTNYGNFKLSSALIYNKALSPTEVAQNYNTLKTRFRL
jgi:hypothetical protein